MKLKKTMIKKLKKTIRFRDLKWTVYNQDNPDQVYGYGLSGPESDAMMKQLRDKSINAAAVNE